MQENNVFVLLGASNFLAGRYGCFIALVVDFSFCYIKQQIVHVSLVLLVISG